ncbi:hypothetical protein H6G89_29715 [Oscillatoria sp. FACHB-1407]|uniref:hypothetical protein n=1 Tax=Oscillatoria sp. FACHB-1407 TaxID=2692847 RepID=UPI0016823633|nr:hypothetical protein [Oscillatoria sp. FACHB-1407]MBD2465190.1 hypothetical protein [Oscillatoria sp. FACHB-1407]
MNSRLLERSPPTRTELAEAEQRFERSLKQFYSVHSNRGAGKEFTHNICEFEEVDGLQEDWEIER